MSYLEDNQITPDTKLLNHFLLISYADLKKYKYYYWFAFPVFVAKPAAEITGIGWEDVTEEFSSENVCYFRTLKKCNDSTLLIAR